MRAHEIGDMNIVADAGAVGRRIVGAENLELGAQAERRFDRDLDQMRGALLDCPVRPLRIGAGDIEIAQDDMSADRARGRRRAA